MLVTMPCIDRLYRSCLILGENLGLRGSVRGVDLAPSFCSQFKPVNSEILLSPALLTFGTPSYLGNHPGHFVIPCGMHYLPHVRICAVGLLRRVGRRIPMRDDVSKEFDSGWLESSLSTLERKFSRYAILTPYILSQTTYRQHQRERKTKVWI